MLRKIEQDRGFSKCVMVPSVFATVISFHLLIVLSLPQIGTTSGGEREQEDFMSMCGPSDLWKCFSRDQVSCCFPPFSRRLPLVFALALHSFSFLL